MTEQSAQSIPTINLTDLSVVEKLGQYIRTDVIVFDMIEEAYRYARSIRSFLEKNPKLSVENPTLVKEHERYVALTQWVACIRLRDEEVLSLVHYHFVEALRNPDLDVLQKIIDHSVTLPLEDRDPFKQGVRDALLQNAEHLTSEYLEDSRGNRQEPTVGNWLRDYYSEVGTGRNNLVRIADYLEHSRNGRKLAPEEREAVKKLLAMIEELKISALEPEGMEVPLSAKIRGKLKILRRGKLEEFHPSRNVLELYEGAKRAMEIYHREVARETAEVLQPVYDTVARRLTPHIDRIQKEFEAGVQGLQTEMAMFMSEKKHDELAAAFIVLARNDKVFTMFVRPRYWYAKTKSLVEEQFSADLVKDFDEQLFSPPYLSIILHSALGGLPEEESAIVGTIIATEMEKHGHKGYGEMAYADTDQQRFVWGKVIVVEGKARLAPADLPPEARGLAGLNEEYDVRFSEELPSSSITPQ